MLKCGEDAPAYYYMGRGLGGKIQYNIYVLYCGCGHEASLSGKKETDVFSKIKGTGEMYPSL